MPESNYTLKASVQGASSISKFYADIQSQAAKTSKKAAHDWSDASKSIQESHQKTSKALRRALKEDQKAIEAAAKAGIDAWDKEQKAVEKGLKRAKRWNNDYFAQQASDLREGLKKQEDAYGNHLKQMKLKTASAKIFEGVEHGKEVFGKFKEQFEGMDAYLDAAKEYAQAQLKFRAMGYSPAQNQKAFAAVEEMTKNIKGVSLTEGVETLRAVAGGVEDLDHALELLDTAGKFRFNFSTIFQGMFDESAMDEQIKAASKFVELSGAVGKGVDAAKKQFDAIEQITAGSGGEVDPQKLLAALTAAGDSMKSLTVRGMMEMTAPIGEVGAAQAGANQAALYQTISQGVTGSKRSTAEWVRLGLLDKSGLLSGGRGATPGANKLAGDIETDPIAAMDKLAEAMKKHGVNITYDEAGNLTPESKTSVTAEINKLFSTKTAQSAAAMYLTKRGTVMGEVARGERAQAVDAASKTAHKDPTGKLKEYEAAMQDFHTKVGLPLLKAAADLAQAWTPVIKMFAEHPNIALGFMAMSKGAMAMNESFKYMKQLKMAKELEEVNSGVAKLGQATEEAGPELNRAGKRLGSGIGRSVAGGIQAVLAAFVIERIVGDIIQRGEDAADRAKAGVELSDLEKKRDELRGRFFDQASGKPVEGEPVTSAEIEELDRQIGAKKVEASGATQGHHMIDYGDFGAQLAMIAKGTLGAAVSGEGPIVPLGTRAIYSMMLEGTEDKRRNFEDQFVPRFSSGDQAQGWMQAIKASGKYDAEEIAALQEMVEEKYPEFARAMGDASTSLQTLSGGFDSLGVTVKNLLPPPQASGGGTAGTKKSVLEQLLPHTGLASGGIVRRPTLTWVGEKKPEAVIPLDRGGFAAGPTHVNYSPVYNINGSGLNASDLRRVLDGHANHVLREIDRKFKDRRLTA